MTPGCSALSSDTADGEGEDFAAVPVVEDDLDYLARRAQQERELAARAKCPRAAMAHMYLAAAYASRLVERMKTPLEFEALLEQLG